MSSHVTRNLITRNARTMRRVIGRTIRTHLVGAYLPNFRDNLLGDSISRMYLNIVLIVRRTNFDMRTDFLASSRACTHADEYIMPSLPFKDVRGFFYDHRLCQRQASRGKQRGEKFALREADEYPNKQK